MSQTATRAATRGVWPIERFETPKQCVGYWVREPRRRKIGKLKWLFLNGSGGPEYAEVKVGLFRMKPVLIPHQSVTVDAELRFLAVELTLLLATRNASRVAPRACNFGESSERIMKKS